MEEKIPSISQLDYSLDPRHALVGAQMFFVAFGALVLVPLLTGLDPSVAMFTAGMGTLILQVCTKGQVPIFLGSSFAFIAPITYGIQQWGLPGTLCGLAGAGVLYFLLSAMVYFRGVGIINRFLPPIVTGPVIMVIGLSLAPVAISMATKLTTATGVELTRYDALAISMSALAATVLTSLLGKGFIRLIPILVGILTGYAVALYYGAVSFTPIQEASWLRAPSFALPVWNFKALIYIIPVAIAPAIEHVGNVAAISSITGRDYMQRPGLHRTLLGDGIATLVASSIGGPPPTTYSEVSGGIALTRAFNPGVMTWAGLSAICLAFVGKLGAALASIPEQVMGGIMVLLFGTITVVGMNSLVKAGDDLMQPRNMAIIAVVLVFGLGGMQFQSSEFVLGSLEFQAGAFSVEGIGLAGLTGLLLNLILPKPKNQR